MTRTIYSLKMTYINIQGQDGHHHSYGPQAPFGWTWCSRCECYVNNPCDHRIQLCRQRAAERRNLKAKK